VIIFICIVIAIILYLINENDGGGNDGFGY
jgi:hypothetical protein